jgi:hypothetical protein
MADHQANLDVPTRTVQVRCFNVTALLAVETLDIEPGQTWAWFACPVCGEPAAVRVDGYT